MWRRNGLLFRARDRQSVQDALSTQSRDVCCRPLLPIPDSIRTTAVSSCGVQEILRRFRVWFVPRATRAGFRNHGSGAKIASRLALLFWSGSFFAIDLASCRRARPPLPRCVIGDGRIHPGYARGDFLDSALCGAVHDPIRRLTRAMHAPPAGVATARTESWIGLESQTRSSSRHCHAADPLCCSRFAGLPMPRVSSWLFSQSRGSKPPGDQPKTGVSARQTPCHCALFARAQRMEGMGLQ